MAALCTNQKRPSAPEWLSQGVTEGWLAGALDIASFVL